MLASSTRLDKNLKAATNASQRNKEPFIFWDENEVSKIDLTKLPELKTLPEDWEVFGNLYVVTLDNPVSIQAFRNHALKYVIGNENETEDIGFAIIWKNEQEIGIQSYRQE